MLKLGRLGVMSFLGVLITAVAFGAGFGTATQFQFSTLTSPAAPAAQDRLKVFWEAWDIVQREYIERDSLDPESMTRGAIKGMVASLDDAHTVYIEPKHLQYEKEVLGGYFSGIGATVTIRDNLVTVIAPIDDSPAAKAGIRAGDRILRVNGESTSDMTLTEAVDKIRGPKGTKVTLTILHDGDSAPADIEVTRDDIKTASVYAEMRPDSIALIRITNFSERTDEEIAAKLREVRKSELKGIILDLRNNPGGYLHIAVNVTSQFLKDGVVVMEEDAKGNRQEWKVRSGGLATDVPLAILVNKGSASASEILAGAVQDYGRGAIVGEETFGKGSAQRQYDLSDGSALAVTVARWLTPKGRQIEGKGLSPDIEVKMTLEEYQAKGDIQLQRAVDYVTTGK